MHKTEMPQTPAGLRHFCIYGCYKNALNLFGRHLIGKVKNVFLVCLHALILFL